MKIVLLTLSGDPAGAHEKLKDRFPGAAIEALAREELERRASTQRVQLVRALKPDVLAIATERLVWQRGQDAFLLLGALAGARRTIILDAHGGAREESRTRALLHAPPRLAREAAKSRSIIQRAESELKALEAAVAFGEDRETPGYAGFQPAKLAKSGGPETGVPRIVYIRSSPGPGTQAGGAASHIKGFIEAAHQLGADVSLISNDEIAGLDQATLPTKIVWPEPVGSSRAAFDVYNNLRFANTAIEEVEKQQPDFIYQRYARFSWAGVAAALRTKRPLFLEYNGSEVWVGRHWDRVDRLDLLARYEKLNLKAAARIFVVSEIERRNLLTAGIEPERIVVNPNGVDPDKFKPGVGGVEARRELDIAPNEVVVGFVGTFGPWHGVEVLAQAITQMPSGLAVKFLLLGTGALRDRVEQTLRGASVLDRVIMLGTVAHERVPRLLDACDILVSPHVPLDAGAEFFGSPTKLFEYMAMGKGIVASRLGQIGEVLEHEKTALLVEPGNVLELTDAISRLMKSPELRAGLGAAARQAAIERHTWKQNAQRVLNEYASL
jgi:glycosyltransferase involved in cell wall biosynthesis